MSWRGLFCFFSFWCRISLTFSIINLSYRTLSTVSPTDQLFKTELRLKALFVQFTFRPSRPTNPRVQGILLQNGPQKPSLSLLPKVGQLISSSDFVSSGYWLFLLCSEPCAEFLINSVFTKIIPLQRHLLPVCDRMHIEVLQQASYISYWGALAPVCSVQNIRSEFTRACDAVLITHHVYFLKTFYFHPDCSKRE